MGYSRVGAGGGRIGWLRGGEKGEEMGGAGEGRWQGSVRQVRGLGDRSEWWERGAEGRGGGE